ncbi:membrane or secreted protein containing DUF928 [Candidatus Magnetoovum chiemensis]|nr:membrane or secreted protein containing DUF928 [Candidatus Magnetoovum chiemensis]
MKKIAIILFCALIILAVSTISTVYCEEKQQEKDEKNVKQEGGHKLFFKFQKKADTGMPSNRVALASRGKGDDRLYLSALVPEDIGITYTSTPSLCWFMSKPANASLELALNDEISAEPLLEKQLTNIKTGGVHCINLKDYAVELKQDIEYQWFISVVPDPNNRSNDITDSGLIKYVEASDELKTKLSKSKGIDVPALYASEGGWYDALSSITELINANPSDKSLLDERAFLLEQVQLLKAAEYDRK